MRPKMRRLMGRHGWRSTHCIGIRTTRIGFVMRLWKRMLCLMPQAARSCVSSRLQLALMCGVLMFLRANIRFCVTAMCEQSTIRPIRLLLARRCMSLRNGMRTSLWAVGIGFCARRTIGAMAQRLLVIAVQHIALGACMLKLERLNISNCLLVLNASLARLIAFSLAHHLQL